MQFFQDQPWVFPDRPCTSFLISHGFCLERLAIEFLLIGHGNGGVGRLIKVGGARFIYIYMFRYRKLVVEVRCGG